MRSIIFVLAVFVSAILQAQSFEGYISYRLSSSAPIVSDSSEIKIPDDIQKIMQEKMIDPQFKQMLKENPVMKQQMEDMMKGQINTQPANTIPKKLTLRIKEDKINAITDSGIVSEFLSQTNQRCEIHRDRKTYLCLPELPDTLVPYTSSAVKTGKTQLILGYNCYEYILKDSTEEQVLWITDEVKGINSKYIWKELTGYTGNMYNMNGLALKIEINAPEMKMIILATELKEQIQNRLLFEIPKGFKEEFIPGWIPKN